jgi:hypothetical protein
MFGRVSPSVVQVGVLALWLGAAGLLSISVAPSLFAVLPSRTMAGAVVGRILPPVFYAGIAIGVLVLTLQVVQGRGWSWGGREIAGLLMIVACVIAQLGIGPRIARLREEIGRPIEELAVDDARRVAFGRLHGFSVAWLGLAMLAAIVATIIAARASSADATH